MEQKITESENDEDKLAQPRSDRLNRKCQMNRKRSIREGLASIIIAVAVTGVCLSQTLIHKSPPRIATTFCFPFALIAKSLTRNEWVMLTAAIGQYPVYAIGIMIGSRRWGARKSALIVVGLHLAAMAIAFLL